MKILFVCENYYPHKGGAEILFKILAEKLIENGHEVDVVTHKIEKTKKFEVINGVKIHRVKCFESRYLFTFLSIPKIVKLAKKKDIIQTITFNGAPPAWVAGKIRRKPVVITILEVWVNKWGLVTDLSKPSCFIHNFLEKMIYKLKFDKYICISDATKRDLLKLKIKNIETTTIYPGMDYDFWNPQHFDREKTRKQLKLGDKFVYFSWGRPGTSKGFEYLIKAVPEISKRINNSQFLFMLSGKDKYPHKYQNLIQLINRLNIQDKVKVLKPAPYKELGNYISAADCVVIPSIAEGFGYTTAESCAMNIPVVASNTGSIPEVISNTHILVKSKDSLSIAKGVEAVYLNKNINKTPLKKFHWDNAIIEYVREYENTIKTYKLKLRKN